MDIEIVESLEGIEAIRPEWEAVWLEDPCADVFASAEWFTNWCEHFAISGAEGVLTLRDREGSLYAEAYRNSRPHVVVIRENGRPAAIAPLVLFDVKRTGLTARVLAPPLNNHSPRGWLLVTKDRSRFIPALLGHLGSKSSWDMFIADGINRDAGGVGAFLSEAARAGLKSQRTATWEHSILKLDGTWEGYLKERGRHLRKRLARSERALEAFGGLEALCYSGASVRDGFNAFMEIDRESWKSESGEVLGRKGEIASYYRGMCDRFASTGRAEVWTLSVGGEPASAFLCLKHNSVLYTIKTSYKEKFSSNDSSPGMTLTARIIENGYSTGLKALDFVGKCLYTERWTPGVSVFEGFTLYASSLYSQLLFAGDELKKRFRG